ncbi:12230_t:CDS:2, partial [Cetraspora pellucida]
FRYNENNQIEFNKEDNNENKFIDENKIESNKENEKKFETKTCGMLGQIYTTKKDILNVVQKIAQHSGFALIQEAKRIAVQILKAGTKPSTIYEAIKDENGEPIATRRDILNL